jgi:hypothetical protein
MILYGNYCTDGPLPKTSPIPLPHPALPLLSPLYCPELPELEKRRNDQVPKPPWAIHPHSYYHGTGRRYCIESTCRAVAFFRMYDATVLTYAEDYNEYIGSVRAAM